MLIAFEVITNLMGLGCLKKRRIQNEPTDAVKASKYSHLRIYRSEEGTNGGFETVKLQNEAAEGLKPTGTIA
jgi:hypothetical protein